MASLNQLKNEKLLIVGCSKNKDHSPGKMPAIQRYNGPAFRILRKFRLKQESIFPSILVLSAKYGIIGIDEMIHDYDQVLKDNTDNQWMKIVDNQLKLKLASQEVAEIFIVAGRTYSDVINKSLDNLSISTKRLVASGGLGVKLNKLKSWLEANTSS